MPEGAEGVNPWLDFGLEVGTRTRLDAVHGRMMLGGDRGMITEDCSRGRSLDGRRGGGGWLGGDHGRCVA